MIQLWTSCNKNPKGQEVMRSSSHVQLTRAFPKAVVGLGLHFSSNGPALRTAYKLQQKALGRMHEPNRDLSLLVQSRPSLHESQHRVAQLPGELHMNRNPKTITFVQLTILSGFFNPHPMIHLEKVKREKQKHQRQREKHQSVAPV